MRRAERLFQIVQLLRRRRVVTALALAEELEVSERTIYRDIRDLSLAGVPVRGEAGVGYTLPSHFDLPPLMFTEEEIEALVLGARMVSGWADPKLAAAARDVLAKVEAVLPDRLKGLLEETALYTPGNFGFGKAPPALETVRHAVRERRELRINYVRLDGAESERTIEPLCLLFWGSVWTVGGWCRMREGFRNFRVDQIETVTVGEATDASRPGRTLDDYFAAMAGERRGARDDDG